MNQVDYESALLEALRPHLTPLALDADIMGAGLGMAGETLQHGYAVKVFVKTLSDAIKDHVKNILPPTVHLILKDNTEIMLPVQVEEIGEIQSQGS